MRLLINDLEDKVYLTERQIKKQNEMESLLHTNIKKTTQYAHSDDVISVGELVGIPNTDIYSQQGQGMLSYTH